MKRLFLILATTIAILPWFAGAVQADVIHWTASGSPLEPAGGFIAPQNGVDAGVYLSPGTTTSGTNSGSVVALEMNYYVNPDAMKSPTFGGPSGNYSLSLTLHDAASGASGSLTFRGNLSGTIAPYLYLTNTPLGPTTQTLTLGHNLYTVTVGPYANPPPPPTLQLGTLSASIAVQPTVSSTTPEPSSLVLACLGLPSLGLARCFRRRKDADGVAGKA